MWADELIEAIEMQHMRLLNPEYPADYLHLIKDERDAYVMLAMLRAGIDFDFYFVALRRLLRTAEQAGREGYGSPRLRQGIREFTKAVPGLVQVRDSGEHPDDWLRQGLTRPEGIGLGGGDAMFSHGDNTYRLLETTQAARALFEVIKEAVPAGAPNEVVKPLKPGEAARAIAEAKFIPVSPDPRRGPRPRLK